MAETQIKLPFWFSGTEVTKLANAAGRWFDALMGWAIWPVQQMDPETCTETVLNLIAWQRDIDRFPGEPLALYRLRVKYAYANAVDSGSVAGFKRILNRLGVGYVEIEERIPGQDWDIVDVSLSDSQLADNQALLEVILQHYGRTCRRYRWKIITPVSISVRCTEFNNDTITCSASMPKPCVCIRAAQFGNDYDTTATRLEDKI